VPSISLQAIGWVWAYNLAWMFILGGVRLITERLVDHRTVRHLQSAALVNQPL
jgi:H+-transporting ATPase